MYVAGVSVRLDEDAERPDYYPCCLHEKLMRQIYLKRRGALPHQHLTPTPNNSRGKSSENDSESHKKKKSESMKVHTHNYTWQNLDFLMCYHMNHLAIKLLVFPSQT